MAARVDEDGLAGHIAMPLDHGNHALGNVIRGAGMLLRRALLHLLDIGVVALALPVALPLGADEAGTDGVDPHFRRQHAGKRQGHRVHRALRGGIGDGAADPGDPGDRADIDDTAVAGRAQRFSAARTI